MSYDTIRPQIKTLLEGVSNISEVANYPKLEFNGYPSAYIIPSDNEADYETTSENVRVYAFIIRVFQETKQLGVQEALNRLEKVVDDILDIIDKEDLKGASTRTIGINLPSGYTFLNVFATPSTWGELPDHELLMAEIRLKIRISVDIS